MTQAVATGPWISVLIVDDHGLVRSGLVRIFSREPDIEIFGEAGSGEEALACLEKGCPDVVLLDYGLPDRDGAFVCAAILDRCPRAAVVMLTSAYEDDVLLACLDAGARGYLTKDASVQDLPRAVRRVAAGEAVLSPRIIQRVMGLARAAKTSHARRAPLAAFEIDILRSLSHGLSNVEIAEALHVTEEVIKSHIRSIKQRLGAADRAQTVAIAVKQGLI